MNFKFIPITLAILATSYYVFLSVIMLIYGIFAPALVTLVAIIGIVFMFFYLRIGGLIVLIAFLLSFLLHTIVVTNKIFFIFPLILLISAILSFLPHKK
jgi:hypothetical protein